MLEIFLSTNARTFKGKVLGLKTDNSGMAVLRGRSIFERLKNFGQSF
jgi:hypothetical protein